MSDTPAFEVQPLADSRQRDRLLSRPALRRAVSLAVPALLIVCVGLAYSNVFDGEFVFDDWTVVHNNPTIGTLWPLGPFQGVVSTSAYLNQVIYARPVSNFLFALSHAFGGSAPWGHHAVNLALHVCSTVLLFAILRRTLRTPLLVERFGDTAIGLAATGALLWGLHPLLTNAVTYISPRMEETMALFYLLTLYAWIRGVQDGSRLWLGLSLGACVLGMMSKEVMVTAPLMVLLYDGLFLAASWREALRRRWIWYVGLLLSMVWLVFLIEHVPGSSGLFGNPTAPEANLRGAYSDRWSYAATMPGVILYYLRLLAWPDPLIFDYKWPVAASWSAILLPASVVAAGGIAVAWGLLRRRAWAYPIAWYLITLLPSSSVIPLYDDYIAEYRVYLPSIGPLVLVLLVAWRGLARTGWARPRRVAAGAFVGILALLTLGGLTYARNSDYRTAISLWSDTVRKVPENERAHVGLAQALHEANRLDEEIAHYREALRLYPHYFAVRMNLCADLIDKGLSSEAAKECEEALKDSEETLRLQPGNVDALSNIGIILMNLGRISMNQGRLDEAASRLRNALRIDSQLPQTAANKGPVAHAILGSVLARQARLEEAAQELREALRLEPRLFETHSDLGVVLAMQGHRKEAQQEFREALRLQPGYAAAERNLNQVTRELAASPEGSP